MSGKGMFTVIAAIMYLLLSGTSSAQEDKITALLRAQTNAFAEASDHQDQAAMDRLLDPDVLFSGGSGQVDRDPERDKADEISALIKTQTQSFLDAAQRRDIVAMRGYLDQALIYVNDDGVVSTLQTFRDGSPTMPAGARSAKVTISDWELHHTGDVAVSSFISDQAVDYGGQSVDYKFLSVEIWILRATRWKLMGSGTIPLHQNPPAMSLPADALAAYVGEYSDGAGLAVTISQDGNALASSVNGEKPTPLVAESRDVFYRPDEHPGYARKRIVFGRDASGRVTEYVNRKLVLKKSESTGASSQFSAALPAVSSSLTLRDFVVQRSGDVAIATFLHERVANFHGHAVNSTYRSMEAWVQRNGNWRMITSQGRELQPDPPAAASSRKPLEDYVGTYAVSPGLAVTISKAGQRLLAATNQAQAKIMTPEAEDMFFIAGLPRTSIVFQRNRTGCVTGYLSRRDERDVSFSRVQAKGDSLLNADRALSARSRAVGFITAYTAAMAPDARKLDAGVPTAIGHDAIVAVMSRYPADLQLDWNPEEAVVASNGDLGYTWGHFVASAHDDKGDLTSQFGRYLDVWRRGSDGLWRWIADIGTSDPPPSSAAPAKALSAEPVGTDSPSGLQDDMAVIPAGRFFMGSTTAETDNNKVLDRFATYEHPRHEATIKSFSLAKHDVTRAEFADFVTATGYNASGCNVLDGFNWKEVASASWRNPGFAQTDRDPVVCVNAADIGAYIEWLSKKTGRSYRLPTEAEWEYAARAGSTTSRYWGDDASQQCSFANGAARSYSQQFPEEPDVNRACSDGYVYTSPVGSFAPNAWGLFDMLGDVWQWTADCGNGNYDGAPSDGSAWTTGDCVHHIYRGGSWFDGPWLLRSATRHFGDLNRRYNGTGFRLARSIGRS
jgi:sulfatase modifying factor 1